MDRPAGLVEISAEDRKLLEGVGSFWSGRTTMLSLWRETDGSLWADPIEYAAWSQCAAVAAGTIVNVRKPAADMDELKGRMAKDYGSYSGEGDEGP